MGVLVAEPVNQTIAAIPTPVIDAIPTVEWMKINPYFDWTVVLGIPFWIFVDVFFVLLLLTVILYWIFRLRKMISVKGYVDAMSAATQEDVMTWIISTTKKLTIECLKKRDTTLSFYNPTNITKWVHTSREAVIHIGGMSGVIVSEDYYKTRDFVSEIALCSATDAFNANNPAKPIKNYTDYKAYGRNMLEVSHPEGLRVPVYSIFNPDKFKKYFPSGLTATLKGGIIIRDARELNLGSNKLTFWEKVIPMAMIMVVALIAICAAWFVPLTGL